MKGLTKLAGLAKSPTETHAKSWIGRFQFDSPPPNRDCISILPQPRKQHTQVTHRADLIRSEAYSLPIRFECIVIPVQFLIGKGEIIEGVGIVQSDLDGIEVRGNGCVEALLVVVGQPQAV